MLSFPNFESHVSSRILERGQEYYEQGQVLELEEISPGKWVAAVEGTEDYRVTVHLGDSEVSRYTCDCPYDLGPVCKHVVAVLYQIREEGVVKQGKKQADPQKVAEKVLFENILRQIGEAELKEFVREYAIGDRSFKNLILARFSALSPTEGGEGSQKYETILRRAFESATDRYGYLNYDDRYKITEPVEALLEQARKLMAQQNPAEALAICLAVIRQFTGQLNEEEYYEEEGDEQAEEAIGEAFDLLREMAAQPLPEAFKEKLFAACLAETPKKQYAGSGYDYEFDWLEVVELMTGNSDREKAYFALLDQMQADYRGRWGEEQIIERKIKFYRNRGQEQEARCLIEAHRYIPRFREMLIEEAVAAKAYKEAKRLVKEGEQATGNPGWPGQDQRWEEWRLKIAELENDLPEIRTHARSLLFRSQLHLDYYRKLKQTYEPKAWEVEREKILEEIRSSKSYAYKAPDVMARIFVEEQDWERLFLAVKEKSSLDNLLQYTPLLKEGYGPELLKLYEGELRKYAEANVSRTHYQHVAKVLRAMQQIEGGDEVAFGLMTEFKTKYKQRRAMQEELNKVIFT